jgi:hypothetical protein
MSIAYGSIIIYNDQGRLAGSYSSHQGLTSSPEGMFGIMLAKTLSRLLLQAYFAVCAALTFSSADAHDNQTARSFFCGITHKSRDLHLLNERLLAHLRNRSVRPGVTSADNCLRATVLYPPLKTFGMSSSPGLPVSSGAGVPHALCAAAFAVPAGRLATLCPVYASGLSPPCRRNPPYDCTKSACSPVS